MNIIQTRYSVATEDLSAFLYFSSGQPRPSHLPMTSGMSETVNGCRAIIARMKKNLSATIQETKNRRDKMIAKPATWSAKDVARVQKRIDDLQIEEASTYQIVEIQIKVVHQ